MIDRSATPLQLARLQPRVLAGDAQAEQQLLRGGALALVQPARHPGVDEPLRIGPDVEQGLAPGGVLALALDRLRDAPGLGPRPFEARREAVIGAEIRHAALAQVIDAEVRPIVAL